jgi:hypothetical protein
VSVFRHRNKRRTSGPSGPHRFVDPADVRSGLALAAMQPTAQMGPALAVTEASLRGALCRMAGCGSRGRTRSTSRARAWIRRTSRFPSPSRRVPFDGCLIASSADPGRSDASQ